MSESPVALYIASSGLTEKRNSDAKSLERFKLRERANPASPD